MSADPALRGRIIVAFAAIYLVWGSTYLAIRIAIETLPPFAMAGMRFLIAGGLLLALARWRGEGWPTPIEIRGAGIVGALLLLGGNGGVVWAEQFVPSGITAVLVGMVPLWMALFQWALPGGQRPSGRVSLGLLAGFGGIVLLVWPSLRGVAGSLHLGGALAVLGGTLSWTAGSLYSRRANLPRTPFMATAWQMVIGGLLLALSGLANGEAGLLVESTVSTRSIVALIYLILFGSILAFTAYTWLLRVVAPTRVATYAYVNPVVALLVGWIGAGEVLGLRSLLAALIIVGAVVTISTAGSTGRPATTK